MTRTDEGPDLVHRPTCERFRDSDCWGLTTCLRLGCVRTYGPPRQFDTPPPAGGVPCTVLEDT